ncbi:MAG: pyroglutamyl-peptidase I [Pseudomonadota bacterium]
MRLAQSNILITGFGPFPGVPHNVSGQFAEALAQAAQRCFWQADFKAACLPTIWHEAPLQLEQLYYQHRPSIALHFGVSHLAKTIVVETTAKNCTGRPDAAGATPEMEHLLPGGAKELSATVPVGRIVARLRKAGIPAIVSHDAGAYLCNALLYHSIELMRVLRTEGQCGFIHLPVALPRRSGPDSSRRAANLDFDRALEGGLEIIGTLMGHSAWTGQPLRYRGLQTA